MRPLKKADVRKRILNKKGKKKGSTSILTGSPNLNVFKKEKESVKKKNLVEREKEKKRLTNLKLRWLKSQLVKEVGESGVGCHTFYILGCSAFNFHPINAKLCTKLV